MFGLGLPELVVIFFVVLLLFGGKAMPEIAKGLGQAIRMFKKEVNDARDGTQKDPLADDSNLTKNNSHDFDPDSRRRDWRPKSGS